jgi:hypothetical protein
VTYIPDSSLSLVEALLSVPVGMPSEPPTTAPVANLLATWVTLTLPCQPCLAPATKMTKPSIFAMPSPRLLISEMVTSYSFPTSTGFGLKDLKPPLPPPLLRP